MTPARLLLPFILLLATLTPHDAIATRVVVPDDVATVQLAVDGSADTVAVRPGLTPERVTASGHLVLEPAAASGPVDDPRPVLQSLGVVPGEHYYFTTSVRGFHLLGEVRVNQSAGEMIFADCVLDSGMNGPGTYSPSVECWIRNCRANGSLILAAGYITAVSDTVSNGTIWVWADGYNELRQNLIVGPAPVGMEVSLANSGGYLEDNVIRGVGVGLKVIDLGYSKALRNLVEDCSSHGIEFASPSDYPTYNVVFRANVVRRCGGDGIHIAGKISQAEIGGNVVEDVGGDGVFATSTGWALGVAADSNRVLRAGGAGLVVPRARSVTRNVVGRCGQAGIDIVGTIGGGSIEHNTSFSNGGAGIRLPSGGEANHEFLVRANLSALNTGPGLDGFTADLPELECNDWYGNLGGLVTGIPLGMLDISINPEFCDLPANDVSLASTSQLLSLSGCDTIGALGVGCTATADVGPREAATTNAFSATPQPARGAIVFRWRPGDAHLIEVFDVTGARRWSAALHGGAREFAWDGRGADGAQLPAGVYLARLRAERGEPLSTRIVLVR